MLEPAFAAAFGAVNGHQRFSSSMHHHLCKVGRSASSSFAAGCTSETKVARCRGKRSSIVEISASRFLIFFLRKLCNFRFGGGFVFRAQALRMCFASNSSSSWIKRLSFTNRTFAPFGYASGTSKSFPQKNTYTRTSSFVGELEEEVDCGVCEGALALPLSPSCCPLGARLQSWRPRRPVILKLLAPRRRLQCCSRVPKEDPLHQKREGK